MRNHSTPGDPLESDVACDALHSGAVQPVRALSRYRWLVLAAGTAAQTSFSAVIVGLPVLAPTLRDQHSLSLVQVGVVLDSLWVGTLLTLLPWGLLADRTGERLVLATGLVGCAAALVGAGYAAGFGSLIVLVGLAGAAGASVNAASGRAVMQWFPAEERGFALGVRQTAIPLGGLVASLVLPALGLRTAFVFLAVLCVGGALFGAAAIREHRADEDDVVGRRGLGETLGDQRLWLLCGGSSLYLVAQLAITGFLVLFLHDERGLSDAAAAGVLGGVQVVAAALRIGGGRWSDRVHSRLRPLRLVGVGSAVTLAIATAALSAPLAILVPCFVLAGGLSMAWNGLSFTAAAEIAGRSRSGAALGMQQSALAAAGAVVPPAFAGVVAATSWRLGFALAAAFPLAGVALLRPLRAQA
jgi:sugar phosphate permease